MDSQTNFECASYAVIDLLTSLLLVKELKLMKYLECFKACHVGLESLKTITEAKLVQMGIPLGELPVNCASERVKSFSLKDSKIYLGTIEFFL